MRARLVARYGKTAARVMRLAGKGVGRRTGNENKNETKNADLFPKLEIWGRLGQNKTERMGANSSENVRTEDLALKVLAGYPTMLDGERVGYICEAD